jgi:hypothetical protein
MGSIQNSLTLKDGAIVGNQMQLVQWSYTAGTTTGLAKYELYSLPNVTAGKTSNTTYWILTSKNPKSNSYYTLQDMNSSTSAIADTT